MFASRTLSLFVRRAASTEAAAAASEAAPAVTGPSKRPNLVEMMMEKPYKGVGFKVFRKGWNKGETVDSYYTLTRVKATSPDKTRGRVWGVLTWRGVEKEAQEKLHGIHKRGEWKYIAKE